MGLNWPTIAQVGANIPEDVQGKIRDVLNKFGDAVSAGLVLQGLPQHLSPIFRPWSLVVFRSASGILAAFSPLTGGVANLNWEDRPDELISLEQVVTLVRETLGREIGFAVALPPLGSPNMDTVIQTVAGEHLALIQRQQMLGRLGDISHVRHLEPQLRDFLYDHPEPAKNVFVMMRFHDSPQLNEAFQAVREVLSARGLHALRADDRDYTGELWSNMEVYLTGSMYGVAILEDIDQRDFNPNVSLELGYMLGRNKRCLILKEQRLPNLPADLVHRLYKPFDMFNISATVTREVARWVDVDLGVSVPRS